MSQGSENIQSRKRKFSDSARNAVNAGDENVESENSSSSDSLQAPIETSMTGRKRKCSDSNDNERLVKLPKPSSPITGNEERASHVLASIKSATTTATHYTCEIKDIDWTMKDESLVLHKDRPLDSVKCSKNVSKMVENSSVTPSTPSNSYKTKDSALPTQAYLLRGKINSKHGTKGSKKDISTSDEHEEVAGTSGDIVDNILPTNSNNDHINTLVSENSTKESPKKVPDDTFNKIILATANKWECASCLIRNLESATKCACCGASGPTSSSTKEPAKPTSPKFKFGLNNSTGSDSQQPLQPITTSKFNFGLNNCSGSDSQQPLQPTTAPKFKFGLNNSSGSDSQQPLQPTTTPKFNFGLNNSSGSGSQQTSNQSTTPKFNFGLQNSSSLKTKTTDISNISSTAEDKSTTKADL